MVDYSSPDRTGVRFGHSPGAGDRRSVHPSRIPISCPLPREQLIAFLAEPDADPRERACDTCAHARRLAVLAPSGGREEFTACHAPERERPGLVFARRSTLAGSHTARPAVDDRVMAAVEAGVRSARVIARAAGIAERTVWKAAARLRATGVLAPDVRLTRDAPEPIRPGSRGPDPRSTAVAILDAMADGLRDPVAIAERVRCHPETVRRHLKRLRARAER